MYVKLFLTGAVVLGLTAFVATRPLPNTTVLDRAPVVFIEQGTGDCVAAFRRGTPNDPKGVTGVHCLAVADERTAGSVVEKFVPEGTTFTAVMEQFSYADPWRDEFIDLDSK